MGRAAAQRGSDPVVARTGRRPIAGMRIPSVAAAAVVAAALVGPGGGRGASAGPAAPPAPGGSPDAGSLAPFLATAGKGIVAPPTVEDVEEMCALLTGCADVPLPPIPGRDLAACVRKMWSDLASAEAVKFSLVIRECALRANSCKELRSCALRGASPTACDGRAMDTPAPVGTCDADGRATTCWRGRVQTVRDCPRGGEQCAARQGQVSCVLGNCDADAGGTAWSCSPNGMRVIGCDAGKLVGVDCAAFGLRCATDPAGKPGCAPASAPACSSAARRCDGATGVGCVAGHEVRVECDRAKLACSTAAGAGQAVGACSMPPAEAGACDPAAPGRCVGTSVSFCVAGRPRTFLCKAFGFEKCAGGPGQAHCE